MEAERAGENEGEEGEGVRVRREGMEIEGGDRVRSEGWRVKVRREGLRG